MANNYRALVKKLQTALYLQKQRRITITNYSMWSDKAGRMVTKYVLSENFPDDAGNHYKTLFSSWTLPDVVKFLADQLQSEGGAQ